MLEDSIVEERSFQIFECQSNIRIYAADGLDFARFRQMVVAPIPSPIFAAASKYSPKVFCSKLNLHVFRIR